MSDFCPLMGIHSSDHEPAGNDRQDSVDVCVSGCARVCVCSAGRREGGTGAKSH